MSPPALRLRGLVKHYRSGLLSRRDPVPAVDEVDLELDAGRVLALVGESGSGKTTLARCVLGLLAYDAGTVELLGQSLASLHGGALDRFRRRVQPLFQDPDAHLNPGLRVQDIVLETARLHRPGEPPKDLAQGVLQQVGLEHRALAWPHQLSGGERRRVGIARLLLCRPELVVADEPTAGLDAARKAEVMELLLMGEPAERATLLISHDLPLVAAVAHRVVVMHGGRIVERCPVERLGKGPHHPYTHELLVAADLVEQAPPVRSGERAAGAGAPGCTFAGRCSLELPECHQQAPEEHPGHAEGHWIACHRLGLDRGALSLETST